MSNNKIRIDSLFNIEKGSLQSSKNIPGDYDFITAAETWKTHQSFTHDCEALVFAAAASGSLGRTHYVNGKFIASDLCYILTPKDLLNYYVDLKFYHFVFNNLREQIVKATKTGTSKDSINITNFSNYEIPYIEERQQKKWIEKLKKAETIQTELLEVIALQQTYLQKLRQSILHDAVQGKLTQQNLTDEPASKLLERIKIEKQKLITAGKLKKKIELSPITEDVVPFELPEGWIWCRLGEIILDLKYGTSQKSDYNKTKHVVLRIPNIVNGEIDFNDLKFANLPEEEFLNLKLEVEDILIVRSNGSANLVGRTAVFKGAPFDCAYAGYLVRLRFDKKLIDSDYIHQTLDTSYARQLIESPLRTTSGVKNINSIEISNLVIPLPPFSEQKHIVTRVQQILRKIKQVEQQVYQKQTQAQQLVRTILKEAFGLENRLLDIQTVKEIQPQVKMPNYDESFFLKPINMNILEILTEAKQPVPASNIWKQSEYKDDIEKFYAELKKLVDIEKKIVEERIDEISYLKLV